MAYFPGVYILRQQSDDAIAQQSSGAAPVTYQLGGSGPELSGIQVSPSQIQPDGYPANPIISIGLAADQASNVKAANSNVSDIWVDEAGDTMTGPLDMSGNQITNAVINQGTF